MEARMPVSLPHALTPADFRPVPPTFARPRNAIDRITDWLDRAERRRAERLIAQYICDAGIQDLSDSVERDIAFRPACRD
jgi:hypothetical protein